MYWDELSHFPKKKESKTKKVRRWKAMNKGVYPVEVRTMSE